MVGLTNNWSGTYQPAILFMDLNKPGIEKEKCYVITYTALNRVGTGCDGFNHDAELEFGTSSSPTGFGGTFGQNHIILNDIWTTYSLFIPASAFSGNYLTLRIYNDPLNPDSVVFIDDVQIAESPSCDPNKLNLISFNANVDENCITNVNWKTSEEVDTDKFEVEQSTDAKNFIKVGTVKASSDFKGTDYISKINQNLPLSYFRLKMFDLDGTITYSQIVSVKNKCDQKSDNYIIYC